jgi:hypothetical protein
LIPYVSLFPRSRTRTAKIFATRRLTARRVCLGSNVAATESPPAREEFHALSRAEGGHEDAGRVTLDDVHRYLEHLKAAGKLSRKSLRDRIASLHALFAKGVKARKLSDNPAKGMLPSAGRILGEA